MEKIINKKKRFDDIFLQLIYLDSYKYIIIYNYIYYYLLYIIIYIIIYYI
jgi:hypothetical protein